MIALRILQITVFSFTILLMLSKEFSFLSVLHESDSIIPLIVGSLIVLNAIIFLFISLAEKKK